MVIRLLLEHPDLYLEVKDLLLNLQRDEDGCISSESLGEIEQCVTSTQERKATNVDIDPQNYRSESEIYRLLRSLEV